jgi:hypothetical protein
MMEKGLREKVSPEQIGTGIGDDKLNCKEAHAIEVDVHQEIAGPQMGA